MDDLQNLSSEAIDAKVQNALGYKPKQSKTTDANLGNIRPVGSNNEFLQTPTREQGIKDIDNNLLAYGQKHGINTLRGVITRWAPASENDTKSYVDTVSKRLSLDPDQKIDLTDPAIRHLVGAGIMLQEKGPQSIYKTQAQPQAQQSTDDLDPLKNLSSGSIDLAVQNAFKEAPTVKPKPKTTTQELAQQATDFYQKNKMTPQEFEKESLLSPITKTLVGVSTGNIDLLKNAAADYVAKSESSVRGLGNIIMHPKETWKQISEHPAETATSIVKGIIYNPTLNPLALKPKVAGIENLAADVARADKSSAGAMFPTPKESPYKSTGATEQVNIQFNAKKGTSEIPKAEPVKLIEEPLHPELQAAVKKLEEKGLPINKEALTRKNEAKSLGVDLTEGQATQDPTLISKERNERGIKENYVSAFNEQNLQLKNKAEEFKTRFAPNASGIDYVANSEKAINAIDKDIEIANKVAKSKYDELKEFGNGKLAIDGQSLGKNALSKLEEEDISEFVPSTIMAKVEKYAKGEKPMNFNLFDNLRTQIAKESRKAERAGDGNTVHALSVIRNSMEDLPIAGETAETKALSDTARNSFKALRDLEDENAFYGKASRDGLDSKNFIRETALGGKNEVFNQAMQVINNNPVAKEHLAQGTMDYIIRESTDGSGNLNPMKIANYIEDMNVNKRLVPLFGEANAQELLKYSRVARLTKAAPEGSFINYSNTLTGAAQLIKEHGAKVAEIAGYKMGIPFVGSAVKKGTEFMEKRGAKKKFEKSMSSESGLEDKKQTKLSDIAKEQK